MAVRSEDFWGISGRRVGVVGSWLDSQRRTEELFKPLGLMAQQESWLKLVSGAGAMPDVGRMFKPPRVDFATGIFGGEDRASAILDLVGPSSESIRRMQALIGSSTFSGIHDATLAQQRITQLMGPLNIPSLTVGLTGISDAVASIASMFSPSALSAGLDLGRIASSALGSWHAYVDSLPSALSAADLFGAQAAGRGVLGITATSAILLGEAEASEVAEDWETAPLQARERLRDALWRISERLPARLDGAWDALTHAGPDAASQAANSAVELIDWTLRLLSEGEALELWIAEQPKQGDHLDANGRPTRQAKIRYVLRNSAFEADFVATTVGHLNALRRELEKVKHAPGARSTDAVHRLLPSVEAVLFLIVVN